MKKRMISALLLVLLLLPVLAVTASADSGPKPSTIITVRGTGELVVLTLLSDREQYGPYVMVQPGEHPSGRVAENEDMTEAWYAFRDYRDPDGFLFQGELWEGQVRWTYWPPETFKIAVYYPERDLLWVSEDCYERYAFRSNYTLVLPAPGEGAVSGPVDMVLRTDTSVIGEICGLLLRCVITISTEAALAGVFGFRLREQRKLIFKTNLATQVGLNAALWGCNFFSGALSAMMLLFVLELVVLIAESIVYVRRLRVGEGVFRTLIYTLCANLASAGLGFLLLV